MKKTILSLLLILIIFTNCNKNSTNNNTTNKVKYPYKVTTTVGMITDIAKNVAGDKAEITGIIGEGVDPHLYKPTRNDVSELLRADVILYSGLLLEGKMSDTFKKISQTKKHIHAVTEMIEKDYLLEPEGMEGHPDPHVWMDVRAWSKAVLACANAFSIYDPENSDYYKKNAVEYNKKLSILDNYAKKSIQSIPEKSRILITAHDAFNYFGRAYNIEVLGIQGLSTESEAGLDDINKLVDLIVERDIKAIFIESSVSDKNVKALIEGAESKGKNLKIGGTLFSDAMGETDSYEGTYIGMIDHNVTIITNALGGTAPEKGLNNQLSGKY